MYKIVSLNCWQKIAPCNRKQQKCNDRISDGNESLFPNENIFFVPVISNLLNSSSNPFTSEISKFLLVISFCESRDLNVSR